MDPELVVRDKNGEIIAVRFEQINIDVAQRVPQRAQESRRHLEATVAQQQKGMEVLTAQLKEQAAQIQKVSAQLEMSKPATKVVVNKP